VSLLTHIGFLYVSLLTAHTLVFVCVSFNTHRFFVCVPLTAYMIWTGSEGREAVKKSDPDLKPTEIMSKMGALWREMSAEDKKKWEVGCTDRHSKRKRKEEKDGERTGTRSCHQFVSFHHVLS